MKAALVQMYCPWGERERTLERIEHYCTMARAAGAELVLFPELTVGGIFKHPDVAAIAETSDGPSVRFVSALASRLGVAVGFGFSERARPLPRNAYCLIDPDGKTVALYRKNFIPRLEVPFWQGGTERPIFELLGRKMGVAICWDGTQKELLADYAARGVEIMLMPHAWDSDPLDSQGRELQYNTVAELIALERSGNLGWWKSYSRMRDYFFDYVPVYATEFNYTACFINQTGQPHRCIRFVGPTFVANSNGIIVAESDSEREQVVYADLA